MTPVMSVTVSEPALTNYLSSFGSCLGHPGHHLLNCFTRGTKPFVNMIGRITVYLQQPSKYFIRSVAPSIKQLRLNLRIFMSPCSYAATTATSQVIVLTKRHFLALSFQAPLKAENSYILVPWERLELSRRKAQVPKTCVSTIPPPGQ
jgi:hypothetical protein